MTGLGRGEPRGRQLEDEIAGDGGQQALARVPGQELPVRADDVLPGKAEGNEPGMNKTGGLGVGHIGVDGGSS
ncbi:hypothetical protein ACIBQ1_19645 [Nonomuraea sp. NPDC050153]|uniref:hypothetical protein n=1 Tax=Nonomuraea sp. NPDC050153 TaxID=3364359 RepID=UPI0037A48039